MTCGSKIKYQTFCILSALGSSPTRLNDIFYLKSDSLSTILNTACALRSAVVVGFRKMRHVQGHVVLFVTRGTIIVSINYQFI